MTKKIKLTKNKYALVDGKGLSGGIFDNLEEAGLMAQKMRSKHHGVYGSNL